MSIPPTSFYKHPMNINTYNLLRKSGEWREGEKGEGRVVEGKDKIPFSGGLTPVL